MYFIRISNIMFVNVLLFVLACFSIISLLMCSVRCSSNEDKIALIRDFLLRGDFALKSNFYLCWKQAEQIRLLKELYKYNIRVSIVEVQRNFIYQKSDERHLHVIDLQCNQSLIALLKANEMNMFDEPYEWFIFNSSAEELDNISPRFNIKVDSKFYVANYEPIAAEFGIKMIYKVHEKSLSFRENEIATWSIAKRSFTYYNDRWTVGERANLENYVINISIVITHNETINHLSDCRFLKDDALTKMNYVLCHDLMDNFNSTANFHITDTWGYKDPITNTYEGMIGDMLNRTALIGGTPLFLTKERLAIVDFVADPTKTLVKFMFRSPPLSYVYNVYTMPFDAMVWVTALALLCLFTVILLVVMKWENTVQNVGFVDILMVQVGTVCQQGAEFLPGSISGRIAMVFILIAITFIYTSYAAFIVVLFQTTTDSIKTVEDLLNSRIELGVEDTPYSYIYFSQDKEPTRKALFEKKLAPKGSRKNFMDADTGIRKMKDEFFAFHIEYGPGYQTINEIFDESEKCGLQEIDSWNMKSPWITMQKNSPYKQLIKIGYHKLRQHGLQARERIRFYAEKPKCSNSGGRFKSIEIVDAYFVFVLFGIGTLLSVTVLVFERIWYRWTKSRYLNFVL